VMLLATDFRISSIILSGPQAATAMRSVASDCPTVWVMRSVTLGRPCWILNMPLIREEVMVACCFSISTSASEDGLDDSFDSLIVVGVEARPVEWMLNFYSHISITSGLGLGIEPELELGIVSMLRLWRRK
jgi:hypothetical protein